MAVDADNDLKDALKRWHLDILGRDAHTVGSWLADFRQHGPAAMAYDHTGGSPPP